MNTLTCMFLCLLCGDSTGDKVVGLWNEWGYHPRTDIPSTRTREAVTFAPLPQAQPRPDESQRRPVEAQTLEQAKPIRAEEEGSSGTNGDASEAPAQIGPVIRVNGGAAPEQTTEASVVVASILGPVDVKEEAASLAAGGSVGLASLAGSVSDGSDAQDATNTCTLAEADVRIQEIIDTLPRLIKPPKAPTVVDAIFMMGRITSINEQDGKATLQMQMFQSWTDQRLAISCLGKEKTTIGRDQFEKVWTGMDIVLANVLGGSNPAVPGPYQRMEINGEGRIKYVREALVQATCTGDYRNWPFDTIAKRVFVGELYVTGSNPPHHVTINWINNTVLLTAPWFHVTNYKIRPTLTVDLSSAVIASLDERDPGKLTDVGNSPASWLFIGLQREWTPHMTGIFMPHMIIITIAWLSLFLAPPPEQVRLSICLSALLVMMVSIGSVSRNLPSTGYMKGVDFWLITHIGIILYLICAFVFLSSRVNSLNEEMEALDKAKEKADEELERLSQTTQLARLPKPPDFPPRSRRSIDSDTLPPPPGKTDSLWSRHSSASSLVSEAPPPRTKEKIQTSIAWIHRVDGLIRILVGIIYLAFVIAYFVWSAHYYISPIVLNRVGDSWT